MGNKEKIEGYLIDLKLSYEELGANAWLIDDAEKGLNQIVVILEEPLVIVRCKVMDLPASGREAFYEELLRLNAQDLLHGAYAIEGKDIILVDTLEVDNLDREEIEATLDAMGLALTQHYRLLSKYRA